MADDESKYISPGSQEFLLKLIQGEITPTNQVDTPAAHGVVVPMMLGLDNGDFIPDDMANHEPEFSIDPREQDSLTAFVLGYHCGQSPDHTLTQTSGGELIPNPELPDVTEPNTEL